jgi:hypothetical protein
MPDGSRPAPVKAPEAKYWKLTFIALEPIILAICRGRNSPAYRNNTQASVYFRDNPICQRIVRLLLSKRWKTQAKYLSMVGAMTLREVKGLKKNLQGMNSNTKPVRWVSLTEMAY